jgi:putative transposase
VSGFSHRSVGFRQDQQAASARRHQAGGASSSNLSDLQQFLNEKLTNPADQRQAEALLTALLNSSPDDDDDADQTAEDRRRRMSGDRGGFSRWKRDFRSRESEPDHLIGKESRVLITLARKFGYDRMASTRSYGLLKFLRSVGLADSWAGQGGFVITDLFFPSQAQMRRIERYCPRSHGIARVDDRRIVRAIVFGIKNGLRWRDAPAEYGPHKTIYDRFIRWSRLGVFNKIFAALAYKGRKPERVMIDATHLKAQRTAASF